MASSHVAARLGRVGLFALLVVGCGGSATATGARPGRRSPDTRPRALALDVLTAVQAGAALDDELRGSDRLAKLPPRRRTFVRRLSTLTVRRMHQLDTIIETQGELPTSRSLRDVLRLGACDLLVLGTPEYAAVSSAVELAKASGLGSFKGLINKRLRGISERREEHAAILEDASRALPPWFDAKLALIADEEARAAIGAAMLREPPLDLTLRDAQDEASALEWAQKLGGSLVGTRTVRLAPSTRGALARMPGFKEGAWWVQDMAATAAVDALAAAGTGVEGAHVCDLCAAPGGKALQLLASGAELTAVDRSSGRLSRLEENLARCAAGARGTVREVVRAEGAEWARKQAAAGVRADAVLVDAPCSGTGLVRRHPACVLQPPKAITLRRLLRSQADLLRAGLALVRPGGVVVYSTCSLLTAEGEEQIDALLREVAEPDALADPPIACERLPLSEADVAPALHAALTPAGDLRVLPSMCASEGGVDGFFVSRLRRSG